MKGEIVSFNGIFGFINSGNKNIYFHRNEIRGAREYLCKGDVVTFKIRPSEKKDDIEAFSIRLYSYGDYRGINNHVKLGLSNSQIGVVKWFDHKKGYGIVTNLTKDEFFWFDKSYLSFKIENGDTLIFEAEEQEKKPKEKNKDLQKATTIRRLGLYTRTS